MFFAEKDQSFIRFLGQEAQIRKDFSLRYLMTDRTSGMVVESFQLPRVIMWELSLYCLLVIGAVRRSRD